MVKLKYSYIVRRYQEDKQGNETKIPNKKISIKSKHSANVYEKNEYVTEINDCIPPILKKVYPQMSYKEYKANICHFDFMDKTVLICGDCYLGFTKFFGEVGGAELDEKNPKLHKGQMYKFDKDNTGLAKAFLMDDRMEFEDDL
jgi:hypothetical protein